MNHYESQVKNVSKNLKMENVAWLMDELMQGVEYSARMSLVSKKLENVQRKPMSQRVMSELLMLMRSLVQRNPVEEEESLEELAYKFIESKGFEIGKGMPSEINYYDRDYFDEEFRKYVGRESKDYIYKSILGWFELQRKYLKRGGAEKGTWTPTFR